MKHTHTWSVAYKSTVNTTLTTRLHCRVCDGWDTVDGHYDAWSENGGQKVKYLSGDGPRKLRKQAKTFTKSNRRSS